MERCNRNRRIATNTGESILERVVSREVLPPAPSDRVRTRRPRNRDLGKASNP